MTQPPPKAPSFPTTPTPTKTSSSTPSTPTPSRRSHRKPFRHSRYQNDDDSNSRFDHLPIHTDSPSSQLPCLTFSARAWLKWQFLCHAGPTEVASWGLSSSHQPLYLDDLLIIQQRATRATVGFDDSAVADLFDQMADQGIPPQRFARIWLHTHPGSSVTPSGTDEETFQRCFGSCDWSVMAILGRTGRTYARLRLNAGPGASVEIPTQVDWTSWPTLAQDDFFPHMLTIWQREYDTHIERMDRFHDDEFCWSDWTWNARSWPTSSQTFPTSTPSASPSSSALINPSPAPVEELDPLAGLLDLDPALHLSHDPGFDHD